MNRKTMHVVGGDKGGCGKTATAMALTESLGKNIVAVETDGEVADFRWRYAGHLPGIAASLSNIETLDDSLIQFFNLLEPHAEAAGNIDFVVNFPAGRTSHLDTMAGSVILPMLEALGIELHFYCLIDSSHEAAECAADSIQNGGLAAIADKKIAVLNRHFGDPGRWPWQQHRQAWLDAGGIERTLPVISPLVTDRLRANPGPLQKLAAGEIGDLTMIERTMVKRWINDSQSLIQLDFPQGEEEVTCDQ